MTTDQKHEELMRTLLATQAEVRKLATIVRGKAEPELWDRRRVAQELDCSMRHVSRLVERGELPRGGMVGGVRLWSSETVRTLNEERRRRIARG